MIADILDRALTTLIELEYGALTCTKCGEEIHATALVWKPVERKTLQPFHKDCKK